MISPWLRTRVRSLVDSRTHRWQPMMSGGSSGHAPSDPVHRSPSYRASGASPGTRTRSCALFGEPLGLTQTSSVCEPRRRVSRREAGARGSLGERDDPEADRGFRGVDPLQSETMIPAWRDVKLQSWKPSLGPRKATDDSETIGHSADVHFKGQKPSMDDSESREGYP